ncbi:Fc.00g010900.m01.CDS01 [Cosmosporella sp. VM-42]
MDIPWPDESIFEPYTIIEETYKTISAHDIKAAILIPKTLEPGRHPVIFQLHGGFLMTAHSLFAPFFPVWASKLALEHSAIIVSADYRLLPSTNGVAEINQDLEDFWQWTRSELPNVMSEKTPGHLLDFSKTLLTGGSAGGYCALQLALSHPDDISVLAMAYPLIDLKDKLYLEGPADGEGNVLQCPSEDMPSREDTVAWIEEKRKVITTKDGFERTPFCIAACQYGLLMSKVLDNKKTDLAPFLPLERIKSGAKLPSKVWIMHGDEDTAVPIRGSQKFAQILNEKLPETSLRLDVCPGHDHAFDCDDKNWESFATAAMSFVADEWLKD